ncbi:hypothetical protein INR49_020869 [Caranx melampygus]|nr:hypothetical protein INR49_020869 [Caranx melampygus]
MPLNPPASAEPGQVLRNQVYQDPRANQQQDLLAAPGDTGGVGRSRDDIPYPTEWTMEWPTWAAAALMVVSRVGPRGLVEVEDSLGRPGPAWTAVWAAYTTVFIPLSSSLYSSKALHFFLWLKQMKELEQEKDSLLAGLEVVERARDWYQGQIHNVTERQRQVGQSSHCTDFFTESNQSRMNLLIPKLQEVNHCLNELISCTGMSFPSGGAQTATLSTNSQPPPPAPPQAIQRLKDQNRLLTQVQHSPQTASR